MTKKGKYTQIEKQFGKPMNEILVELYAKHQGATQVQHSVAKDLGVSQGTVSLWLLRCGLRQTVRLIDREAAQ